MSPCLNCEYGQRATLGPLDAYTATADIPVSCRCPMKVNGRCTCGNGNGGA